MKVERQDAAQNTGRALQTPLNHVSAGFGPPDLCEPAAGPVIADVLGRTGRQATALCMLGPRAQPGLKSAFRGPLRIFTAGTDDYRPFMSGLLVPGACYRNYRSAHLVRFFGIGPLFR
jgi:hypothetical protein